MRSNGDKRTVKTTVAQTRARRTWKRVAIGALALTTMTGVIHTASAANDPASTYAGTHLTVQQAAQAAYNAGFHTEQSILAVVSIGIAESGLVTGTRNWHSEFGFRPATDVIGVHGPDSVWSGNRQMHSDRGAWQISSHFWPQYTDAQTDNPASAAKAMFSISRSGTDFSLWDTYKNGDAQQYFDGPHDGWPALRPIVKQVIAAGGGSAPTPAPAATPAAKPAVKKPVVTTPVVQKPAAKPAAAKPAVSNANEIRRPGTYVTAYDWQDNNPPNSAEIANPVIHQKAGGTGTYADPITVAVEDAPGGGPRFAPGTRFYVPNVRAYLIAEDRIGDTGSGRVHLDMWAGGQTSSQSSAYNCMSHVTGNSLVIQNPASNYAVVPGPLSANNTCRALFGDAVVTMGAAQPITTPAPPAPPKTVKPPAPVASRPPVITPVNPPTNTGGNSGESRHKPSHRRHRHHQQTWRQSVRAHRMCHEVQAD